jgi:hypothetical protein
MAIIPAYCGIWENWIVKSDSLRAVIGTVGGINNKSGIE